MSKKSNKETASEISDRFEEAIATLKRLYVPKLRPKAYFNAWPDIVYTTWELQGQEQLPVRLGPPTAEAISRMEEVFNWVWLIDDEDERNLIWMRASGMRWKVICRKIGCGRTKAWENWVIALCKLSTRINIEKEKKNDVRT